MSANSKQVLVLQILDDLLSKFKIEQQNATESTHAHKQTNLTVTLINGTVGIGKTSVGSALSEMYDNCLFLDGDAFYQHSSLNHANCDDWYSRWISIICTNIELHLNKWKDVSHFVISYVFEDEQCILDLVHAIRSIRGLHSRSVSVYSFLLHANMQVIEQRIQRRAMSVYDTQDTKSLAWDLKRSRELRDILHRKHRETPHSLGQLVDSSDFVSCKQTAMHIKAMLDEYQHTLKYWTPNHSEQELKLKPLDFCNRFENMIVNRNKRATTRWPPGDEPRMEMKSDQWMMATVDDVKTPFGIVYVHNVEEYKLKELTDRIAKIENMKCGKELISLLKELYEGITDDELVYVVYFTCCHFV